MTDLQREWEDILESRGLPADRGDTVLDQTTYLGKPCRAEPWLKASFNQILGSGEKVGYGSR